MSRSATCCVSCDRAAGMVCMGLCHCVHRDTQREYTSRLGPDEWYSIMPIFETELWCVFIHKITCKKKSTVLRHLILLEISSLLPYKYMFLTGSPYVFPDPLWQSQSQTWGGAPLPGVWRAVHRPHHQPVWEHAPREEVPTGHHGVVCLISRHSRQWDTLFSEEHNDSKQAFNIYFS